MTRILLDTNVVSELMRTQPDSGVMNWFAQRTDDLFCVSSITQAEILLGIALLPAGKRRTGLTAAATEMFAKDFAERCLPFDTCCTSNYAAIVSNRRRAGFTASTEDAMIAAIALTHGCALATRNTKDFIYIDRLTLMNPWMT